VTIIIGITTPDGVVLASDSRTTQSQGESHRVVSDNAQKVFKVGGFGVATSGIAFIGNDTIAGLMDQFLSELEDGAANEVGAFSDALAAFFDERFMRQVEAEGASWDPEENGWVLTFLVAGYDDAGIGHIIEVTAPGKGRGDYSPNTTAQGVIWRGQTDVIQRMIKGVDWSGLGAFEGEIQKDVVEHLNSLEYMSIFPITVQDAIDYGSFLVKATIDMQRFSDGTLLAPGLVPGCGGPLQILAVERSEAKWVSDPTLHLPA